MALSYTSATLGILMEDYKSHLTKFHSLSDFRPADLHHYASNLPRTLPLPPEPEDWLPEVGTLYWPTGFTRCAFGHFLVDSTKLADIRTALGDGSAGPATLAMSDGTGQTRSFSLRMLPPRPLSQITGKGQGYLLTLADARYWKRHVTGSITSTPVSWTALLNSLATGLGITLSIDTINAAYGAPTSIWKFNHQPLAPVLDAVCNRIGHRLVANLDGTFSTVSYATSRAACDSLTGTLTRTAGGLMVSGDLVRPVPASIKTVFRNSDDPTTPHTVTSTLTGLAITEYGSASGIASVPATIYAELVYDGTNGAACTAYATQAAKDWYLWRLVDVDATYPGVCTWAPTGCEDRIEWRYQADGRVVTRVAPPPFRVAGTGTADFTTSYGCHLVEDEGEVDVDVQSLAGDGLYVTDDDCPKLSTDYYPPDYDPDADCVTWYTAYLHLGGSAVSVGQTLGPRAYLGRLGPYSNGAHLHWSLGDGDQSQNPVPGAITAGVAANIESWITTDFGIAITGSHVGTLPSPLADFTVGELALIRARTAFPLDPALAWECHISSPLHTGWDYYGTDWFITGDDVQGQPVYAGFQGSDVKTVVTFSGYTPGVGWVVILKHQIGDCPEDSGDPGEESIINRTVGCGLTYEGGLLRVDTDELAGDPADTSLVDDGCTLAFDKTIVSTVPVTYLVLETGPCSRLNIKKQTITDRYNVAGVIVDRTYGATSSFDFCHYVACCEAGEIVLDATVTPQFGLASLVVTGDVAATGGVEPYTYSWKIDGLEVDTTDTFGHNFTTPGLYEVTITVTDSCCESVTETFAVAVGDECECTGSCPDGQPEGLTFTLTGGTGDFLTANGSWTLYPIGACQYGWIQDGWTAIAGVGVGSGGLTLTLTNAAGKQLDYEGDVTDCCEASTNVEYVSSVGTGTAPTLSSDTVGGSGSCEPCCITEPTPGECCDLSPGEPGGDGMPNAMTVVITTTIPGLSGTYSVTRPSDFGSWTRSGAPTFENPSLSFGCTGGSYSLVITAVCEGGMPPFGATLTASPSCCEPFEWNGSGSTNTGCYTSTSILATVTP